uniref:thread biopolymer filament subunit gamma-like isoform X2 n=1 Tax=Myxine glutinosa TaxID=7769 RepID=UPI00358DDB94
MSTGSSSFSQKSSGSMSACSGSKLSESSSRISATSTPVVKSISMSQSSRKDALSSSGASIGGRSSMAVGGMCSGGTSMGSNMTGGFGMGGGNVQPLTLGGGGFASSMGFCSNPSFQVGRSVAVGGMRAISGSMGIQSLPPMLTRDGEQQILRALNQRFMVYMEKVQSLTQENAMLEAQLQSLTGSTTISIETEAPVDASARFLELRTTLDQLTVQNVRFEIELDNVRTMAGELKAKYDFEIGVKCQLESDIVSMRQDHESAMEIKMDLENKYHMLTEEIAYLKQTQEEELAKLGIKSTSVDSSSIEVDNRSVNMANILCAIREEYNAISEKNTEEAEAYYKTQIQRFENESREVAAVVTTTSTETMEITKTVQEMQMQLQSLHMRHNSLQQMLMELEGQFQTQISSLQSQSMEYESSIEHHRAELQKQLVAFRTLMDIKIALDQEIATYRKILEGVSLGVTTMDMSSSGSIQSSTLKQYSTSSTGSTGQVLTGQVQTGQVLTGQHSHSSSAGSQSSLTQQSSSSTGEVTQTSSTTTKEVITEKIEPVVTKKITTQVFEMVDGEVVSTNTSTQYIT